MMEDFNEWDDFGMYDRDCMCDDCLGYETEIVGVTLNGRTLYVSEADYLNERDNDA